jgi:hypothetical protein
MPLNHSQKTLEIKELEHWIEVLTIKNLSVILYEN